MGDAKLRSDLGVRRTDANGVRLVLGHAEVLFADYDSKACLLPTPVSPLRSCLTVACLKRRAG